jgi:hypothetical protein
MQAKRMPHHDLLLALLANVTVLDRLGNAVQGFT